METDKPKMTLQEHMAESKRLDRQIVVIEDVSDGQDENIKHIEKMAREGLIYLVNTKDLSDEDRRLLEKAKGEDTGNVPREVTHVIEKLTSPLKRYSC